MVIFYHKRKAWEIALLVAHGVITQGGSFILVLEQLPTKYTLCINRHRVQTQERNAASAGVVFQSTLLRAYKSAGINYDFSCSVLICLRNSLAQSRLYYPLPIVCAWAGVGTQGEDRGNNLSGSFSPRIGVRRHCSRRHSSTAVPVPRPESPRDTAGGSYAPRARPVLQGSGKAKFRRLPARVTGRGIKVFSHDTLLPITDSGSV